MDKLHVGLDWGGTKIKIGIFKDEKLVSKHSIASGQLSSPDKFFKILREDLEKAVKKHNCAYSCIHGAGIGIPGLLNVTDGFIYYLPNIKGWENFAFRETFEKEMGFKLVMDNDANVAALSEFKRGAAVGYQRGIVFTLGTGLGSGLFLNGQMYSGDCSSAEAGHMPVNMEGGKKCGCSSKGCIETYVGIRHLVDKAQQFMKKEPSSMKNLTSLSPKDIFDAAKQGDNVALKCWEYLGYTLGTFSAGLVNLLDLQIIVVGGGVAGAYKYFAPSMNRAIKERAMHPLGDNVVVKKAKFSNDAGIYGAYELIKEVEERRHILSKYQKLVTNKKSVSSIFRRQDGSSI